MEQVAIVSCDIVAHGRADHATQRSRVGAINGLVGDVLGLTGVEAVWASGGDGGHVVFRGDGWQGAAVGLVRGLRQWARTSDVPLRITTHFGEVSAFEGADGRTQFVGEAINVAGGLLELARPDGVLASSAFASRFNAGWQGVMFHDARWIEPSNAAGFAVFLLSAPPEVESAWNPALAGGAPLLVDAMQARDAWEVLYQAKRLMQVDAGDRDAERSIRRLSADQLRSGSPSDPNERQPNPFLSPLDGPSRVELVRGAELVERRRGEVICRDGDSGNVMFVLLRGRVGVFLPPGAAATGPGSEPLAPTVTLGTGDVVGELAFALQRERTATLVALDDVAMLGFTYEDIASRLRGSPLASQALGNIEQFVTARVLANLYEHAPELVPAEDAEWASPDPVDAQMDVLDASAPATTLLRFATHAPLSTEALLTEGVSILASGRLHSDAIDAKQLVPDPYRLLHVDLPGLLVTPVHDYVVDRPTVVVHIGSVVMSAMRSSLTTYLGGLRKSTRHCYFYDAFLSYAFDDDTLVRRWQEAFERQGLRVFRDEQRIGHTFPERLEAAIRDALTMVVFVSANTMVHPPEQNWVRREVEFRQDTFANGNAAIIPVALPGGRVESIASGHTPVVATGPDEREAIEAVVRAIRRIRDGNDDPPFGRARSGGVRLSGSG